MNVFIEGRHKGEVTKDRGRWHWFRKNGGVEIFSKLQDRESVRHFIARVCLTTPDKVEFSRRKPDDTI